MMSFFKNILGGQPEPDYKKLIEQQAQILDVRSPGEFQTGHIPNAIHIPLPELAGKAKKLSKSRPVIVYCASGGRSASAAALLKSMGFSQVVNGGGMHALRNKLK